MTALIKGTVLDGSYEIIEEIGSGGGGIVYRARHLRLQTDVVIKKIKDEVREKIKLRQEVDILKKLKHPYLPRVYDFIETEDGVYTVMDFINGEDLETAVKRNGKFSQKQVKKWAEQLGEVLAYLHSQNPPIIHSDIKPANIMLTDNDDICLIDFNISLVVGVESESTVGISAGFSPPEQYRDPVLYARMTHNYTLQNVSQKNLLKNAADEDKTLLLDESTKEDKTLLLNELTDEDKTLLLDESTDEDRTLLLDEPSDEDKTLLLNESSSLAQQPVKEQSQKAASSGQLPAYTVLMGKGIDARSDIYSLGVTLYYLLTGIEPSPDFDKQIPISETNVYISEGLVIILEKMMELSPDKRYQNGAEYLNAIQNCHKLDKRYIQMKRKQTGIQIAALGCLFMGILLVFMGLYKIRADKNSEYFAFIQQAEALMEEYEFDAASTLLEEAKLISDTKVSAYKDDVYLLYLSGNYEECIALGEKYINTAPFLVEASEDEEVFGDIYYLVGNAYFEQEDYVNAKNLFEYAMQYNAKNGLYYRDYAIVLAKMGQLEDAKAYLEQGIALGIAQDSVSMVQGELAHVEGSYEEAVEYLRQTLSLTTDLQMRKRAILLSVDVYKTIGDSAIDEEIALLEQYSSEFEEKGSFAMLEYLADAYVRKAGTNETEANVYYDKALSLFQEISDKGYMTYQLKENMAILYENMDCFEESEKLLLQMAEEYPNRYEVHKRLAYLEADKQQMKENIDRDYALMREYYEIALKKYSGKEQDMEMEMLERMMQELEDGGWF